MKRLVLIFLFTFFATGVNAAWTISASVTRSKGWTANKYVAPYQGVYEVKLICESDGADPDEFLLSTYLTGDELRTIAGGVIISAITAQGTNAPAGTYAVAFDGPYGQNWLTITTTSTTQAEEWDFKNDLGFSTIFWDLQIDYPDIGDNGDDVVLYLNILR